MFTRINKETLFKVKGIDKESGIITDVVKITRTGSSQMGFLEIQKEITGISFDMQGMQGMKRTLDTMPQMFIPEKLQSGVIGDESVVRIISVFTAQPPNSIFRLDDSMWFIEMQYAYEVGVIG